MQLLRKLLAQIRVAESYSIIADETRDLSGAEQFAIYLRWVDAEYNVYEHPIGIVDVESTTAEKLTSAIKDICRIVFFHWLSAVDRHMMELQIWQDPLRVLQSVSRTNNHPQSLVTAWHTILICVCKTAVANAQL